ncbi:MAG: RNA 2',3'-cyclic phosphodiesterase [Deltaproteobacteria bacterium]|nr:RNA 2',3'-cyclic phosphodiesterase [Deltaproteobacteria bacterium]
MIRAFIGVRIDPDMAQKVSEIQSQLRPSLTGIRWIDRENLHFTLKFLGAVKEEKVTPIIEALEYALRPIPRFPIIGRGIGVFPDIRKAKVLWAGLEGKGLGPLAMAVESALEAMGFVREKRAYKPHLTIGRWRNFDGRSERLKDEIDRWRDHKFGESWVREVVFFQSILKPEGTLYSPLQIIPLSGQ